MKPSGIGGQAVLEGIMMKNKDVYAVAVRKPDQEIAIEVSEYKSITKRHKIMTLPFIRGTFNLVDSLILGMKTISFSAKFYEDEEELNEEELNKKERVDKIVMTITMILSVVLALGLFMVLPTFMAGLFRRLFDSQLLVAVLEGVFRFAIFIGYLLLISRMKDIKRTFMYHGAEHKCINCIEHGLELTVENVRISSRQHKRCGTSFLFFVIIVSIIVGFFIHVDTIWLRALLRVLMLPLVAGISYEFIRLAGRTDFWLVNLLSKPGLLLQKLTTSEPEDDMIEVAIKAVEKVFDWRSYLKEASGDL